MLTLIQPHERIIASVIYYYETDADIQDPGLSFRYLRCLLTDFPSEEEHSADVCALPFWPGHVDD
jgi:hypothetical protein